MSTNAALQARRIAAIPRGVATAYPVFAERAEGSELWDMDGKRYIDFAGGIAVLNTGHRHPKVIAAVKKQLDAFTHTAFQIVPYEPYIELCERLNTLAPFTGRGQVDPVLDRRRGGRERGQDRARLDRPHQRHRLLRLLPRPHADDQRADRQGGALQEEVRPDAGRHLARAVPGAAARRDGRGFAEGASTICSAPMSTRSMSRRSSSSRCRARAASIRRRPNCCRRCASSATSTASC